MSFELLPLVFEVSNTATELHRSVPNGTDDFRSARESRPPPPLHSLFGLHVSRSSKSSCPHQVTFFVRKGADTGRPRATVSARVASSDSLGTSPDADPDCFLRWLEAGTHNIFFMFVSCIKKNYELP